ncbi:hypothetical protein [Micromonospora sp. NPDC093244]|uniref:hypothetical protein n=1 Tax=Micromonospora sp. NPDC093244 TaxID=3155071 RepID=UPI0034281689
MDESRTPVTLHVYCRIDVLVTDPEAVTAHAVAALRSGDIDWSTEEEDVDTATTGLRSDLVGSVSPPVLRWRRPVIREA